MSWLLASVSGNIPRFFWDKHHQTSFPSKHFLLISDNLDISAVIRLELPLYTNKQHRTNLLQIPVHWESPATCSYTQQDPCWVEHAGWLLLIPFWREADYIFLRTSHSFSLSSSSPIPHLQIMATPTLQPAVSRSESSRSTGSPCHASLDGTQYQRRHRLIQHDAANASTANMTQDSRLKIICNARSRKSEKQHAIGCEYIHIVVNGCHLTDYLKVDICIELSDQFIAAHNGKLPSWTKAFVHTEPEMEHQDVVRSRFFAEGFRDMYPWERTKQA